MVERGVGSWQSLKLSSSRIEGLDCCRLLSLRLDRQYEFLVVVLILHHFDLERSVAVHVKMTLVLLVLVVEDDGPVVFGPCQCLVVVFWFLVV